MSKDRTSSRALMVADEAGGPLLTDESAPSATRVSGRSYSEPGTQKKKGSKPCCTVLPFDPRKSKFPGLWSVVVWWTLLVICIVVPYEIAFEGAANPPKFFWTNRFFDLFTVMDMFFSMVTAQPHPEHPGGRYQTSLVMLALYYFQRHFLVDALSLLPSISAYTNIDVSTDVFRFFRLARLLRMRHFFDITREWQISGGFSNAAVSLVNNSIVVGVATHFMACLWGWTAISAHVQDPDAKTWLDAVASAKSGPAWEYQDAWGVYTLSLYWAIMTLTSIGYGDITATYHFEYWVCSGCMVCSGALWAFTIGEVCGILTTLLPHDVALKQQLDDLNMMLSDRQVPRDMRKNLRRFLFESQNVRAHNEHKQIMARMSPMLQGEIIGSMMDCFASLPYLQNMPRNLVVILSARLEARLFAPKEIVEPSRAICSVKRGLGMRESRLLTAGALWGQDMILENEMLRNLAPVRALSYLEIVALPIIHLVEALQFHPEQRKKFRYAVIRYALSRGVILLAAAAEIIHKKDQSDLFELPEAERHLIVHDVLANGLDAAYRRASTVSRIFSHDHGASYASASQVRELQHDMDTVKRDMAKIAAAVSEVGDIKALLQELKMSKQGKR